MKVVLHNILIWVVGLEVMDNSQEVSHNTVEANNNKWVDNHHNSMEDKVKDNQVVMDNLEDNMDNNRIHMVAEDKDINNNKVTEIHMVDNSNKVTEILTVVVNKVMEVVDKDKWEVEVMVDNLKDKWEVMLTQDHITVVHHHQCLMDQQNNKILHQM